MSQPFVINPGPVRCAGEVATFMDQIAPLPNMSDAIRDWFKPLSVGKVTPIINEAGKVESSVSYCETAGFIQPDKDGERLARLPGGNRSWKYWVFYSNPNLKLETDDKISILQYGRQTPYTVNALRDFSECGYMRFSLIEGYRR